VSRNWKRYGEARLYLIAGSMGLLAIIWSALYAQDHRDTAPQPVEGASTGPVTAETASSNVAAPAQQPQTRTRGS
jgi:hypothetical protein